MCDVIVCIYVYALFSIIVNNIIYWCSCTIFLSDCIFHQIRRASDSDLGAIIFFSEFSIQNSSSMSKKMLHLTEIIFDSFTASAPCRIFLLLQMLVRRKKLFLHDVRIQGIDLIDPSLRILFPKN